MCRCEVLFTSSQCILCVAAVAMMRVISERHLAAMVVKGICQFPENGDRLGGTIDIWWIVRILYK